MSSALAFFVILLLISEAISDSEKNSSTIDASDDSDDDDIRVELFSSDYRQAIEMIQDMDEAADPCADFYQYACGDFNEHNPIEPGRVGHAVAYRMANNIKDDLQSILLLFNSTLKQEWDSKDLEEADVLFKVGEFYESCLNANVFKFRSYQAYKNLLDSIGGMPVMKEDWNEHFNITTVLATLRLYGVSAFIDEYTTKKYVYVKKAGDFGLLPMSLGDLNKISSRSYNINKKLMHALMSWYGAEEDDAWEMAEEILQFGKRFLTKLQSIPAGPKGYKTLSKLHDEYPHMNWYEYFETLFGHPVEPSFKVIIYDLNYFKQFPILFPEEDKKTIANYLMLKLLFELHEELKSAQYIENFCVKQTQRWLDPIPNIMYIKSGLYDDSIEENVTAMANDIRTVFKETILTANWLDETTKTKAVEKLMAMNFMIGSPNISEDINTFNEFYRELKISPTEYDENILNVRRFKTTTSHQQLIFKNPIQIKVDIEVNAQYGVTTNVLDLPPGILQKPMYHPKMPAVYNFASMGGNIIGHEMVHAFDSIGRHYGKTGRKEIWWSPESSAEFDKRAQCFVEQYNQYTIEAILANVNGSSTLAENIADNGGLRLGFYAYKKWTEKHSDNELLDDLYDAINISQDQLYFWSFAHASCSEFKRKGLLRIAEDVHTADKFRVIGPLSNFDEFGKAFNCTVGSPMNPVKKCVLW